MKEFLKSTVGIILSIMLLIALIFGGGYLGLKFKQTFGKASKDIDREIFKSSVTYNEGVLDDLAKYKYELQKTSDAIEKSAIAELVNSRFVNYDVNKIENDDLREFLNDCRNGKYLVNKENK